MIAVTVMNATVPRPRPELAGDRHHGDRNPAFPTTCAQNSGADPRRDRVAVVSVRRHRRSAP